MSVVLGWRMEICRTQPVSLVGQRNADPPNDVNRCPECKFSTLSNVEYVLLWLYNPSVDVMKSLMNQPLNVSVP